MCISATGVFTQMYSEVHYQFHVCVSQFVDLLNTCSVALSENRKPVVFLFVSGSVNVSSNISASKGLLLSGTLSAIHPNCFKVGPSERTMIYYREPMLPLFQGFYIVL